MHCSRTFHKLALMNCFDNIHYLYNLFRKYMYVESKYHSFPVSSFCKYLLYDLLQCSISLINYSTGIRWFSQFFSCMSCYYIRTQKVHIFVFCVYTCVCAFKTYNWKGKCRKILLQNLKSSVYKFREIIWFHFISKTCITLNNFEEETCMWSIIETNKR